MIITVTLNPAVDKTVMIPDFSVDAVNRVQDMILDPGGKGINVSKSVQALGGDTLCIGIVGGDSGRYICAALDQIKIRHDMVLSDSPTRTNLKIVDLQNKTNTDINEAGAEVTQPVLDAVWNKLSTLAKPNDTVVIAGKNPPGTPPDLLARWTKALRLRGICVCLDTVEEPMQLALKEAPHVIKPNKEELCELLGKNLRSDKEVLQGARELIGLGVELVAVSMGAEGAMFVTKDTCIRTTTPKVTAISTVGAGDSMMAAIVHYRQQGLPLQEVARRATAVATATVQVPGSQPAKPEQIEQIVNQIFFETL